MRYAPSAPLSPQKTTTASPHSYHACLTRGIMRAVRPRVQAPEGLSFVRVGPERAADVRALAAACAADLRERFGPGHWARVTTLRTWKLRCGRDPVYLGLERGSPVATL